MMFHKWKCKVLHQERSNPRHQDKLGATQLESSSDEKELGILVVNKSNMSQQRDIAAKKDNSILDYIRHSFLSRSREMILLLLSIGKETPGMLCPVLGSVLGSARET